jgi:SAM-dependent methyltransferase
MGLLLPVEEVIFTEHCYKKIEGNALFIGRQTTYLDENSLNLLLKKYGLSLSAGFTYEYDHKTIGAKGQNFITERCFMRSIGVGKVDCLDVTDYEGAEIVHDLGYPVPESLLNRYDFIYNGGCFDNMFNPGVAIVNLSKMLRPGGRVVCLESVSSWNCPYIMFSPAWFWDYYVTNGFTDCKVYIASYHDTEELFFGPCDWYFANLEADRNGAPPEAIENNHLVIVTIAEKGSASTSERQPIQDQYRLDDGWRKQFDKNVESMRSCKRPIVLGRNGKENYPEYLTHLGKIGVGIHPQPAIRRFKKFVRRNITAARIVANMLRREFT